MEQETLFRYRPSKQITVYQGFLLLISVFIFGCWVSIFLSGAIFWAVEKLFSVHFPGTIFLITYIGISLFTIYSTLKGRTRNLVVTTDKILWENSLGQTFSINTIDITKVRWKNRQIHINDRKKLFLPPFPNKESIIFNSLLLDWFPSRALDEDTLKLRRLRKSIFEENNIEIPTIIVETNRRKQKIFRAVSIIASVVVLFLVLWTFLDGQNGFGVAIGLGLFILSIAFVVWISTRYRAITVRKDGILYQRGKKDYLYAWEDIEAIGFHLHNHRMHLWINEKQKLLSYGQMNVTEVNDLGNIVYRIAISKSIPVGIV